MYDPSFRLKLNCYWVPALIGAAASVAGSIIGNSQSGSNVKSQLAAQSRENAINRQFNASEAEKNRQFQQSQIADYRAYNSPANQAKLMQEAGYHPMAALGQFGSMDAGISSGAQASSSGGISPVGYSPLDLSSVGQQIANIDLMRSQAEKNRADAHQSESEALSNDALRDGLVTLQNIEVEYSPLLHEANISQMRAQVNHLNQLVEQSKEEIANIAASTLNIREDTLSKSWDNAWKKATLDSRIRTEAARAGLTETQYKYEMASFALRLMNLQADTNDKLQSAFMKSSIGQTVLRDMDLKEKEYDQFSGIRYTLMTRQNQRMIFDLKQDMKWDDKLKTMQLINSTARDVGSFLLDFRDGIPGPKPTRVGFRNHW
ncbi:DNA pilot protein [Peromfec virus RodF8_9]|uniref:DNA pilot protein n=1 Tax=Peromfec virus RodF8_9 TaxID=2929390 RepID=A0A976N2C9_9VIRU|nr:DNA pilot protein [Peromfec virus RodF8_9]